MHTRVKDLSDTTGVLVTSEWHDFKNFHIWFEEQRDNGWWQHGWHLDKDIISKGKRIYSPENCAYVPPHINLLFVQAFNRHTNFAAARGVNRIKGIAHDTYRASFKAEGKVYQVGDYDSEFEAFFMGKFAKEQYIQDQANKLKDNLNPKMYEALMSYRVMPR